MNKVSIYSSSAWIEDLPELLQGRWSHGCGHYVNDDNKMVKQDKFLKGRARYCKSIGEEKDGYGTGKGKRGVEWG